MATVSTLYVERAARIFHALADETRLRIIGCLADGEQCVCDLTVALATGQSRLSFHLKTLKEAGILRDRRQGRWVYYALEPLAVEEVRGMLAAMATADRRPGPDAGGWPGREGARERRRRTIDGGRDD